MVGQWRCVILIIVGKGPIVLAVDAIGSCLDIFALPVYHVYFLPLEDGSI